MHRVITPENDGRTVSHRGRDVEGRRLMKIAGDGSLREFKAFSNGMQSEYSMGEI
jgi:hypothetical protein